MCDFKIESAFLFLLINVTAFFNFDGSSLKIDLLIPSLAIKLFIAALVLFNKVSFKEIFGYLVIIFLFFLS